MFWGAFGWNGVSDLVEIQPKSNSENYQEVLKKGLLTKGAKLGGKGWIFQQDNAAIHGSKSTQDFLKQKKIRLLPWSSRSPDLNPIENLWGIMSCQIYAGGVQFKSKKELVEAIKKCWYSLPLDLLRKLIVSMKNRVFSLIKNSGDYINY